MITVRPEGTGNITDSQIAWMQKKSVSKKASPIVVGGLIYMVSDDGIASCRRLSDGEMLWQKRLGSTYAASPIYADGRLYLFNVDGEITTLQTGKAFEQLAATKLGDGFMASPAIVGNQMILRSKSKLYSIVADPEPR